MEDNSLEGKLKKLDESIEVSEKSIENIDITTFILEKGKLYKENKKKVSFCLSLTYSLYYLHYIHYYLHNLHRMKPLKNSNL